MIVYVLMKMRIINCHVCIMVLKPYLYGLAFTTRLLMRCNRFYLRCVSIVIDLIYILRLSCHYLDLSPAVALGSSVGSYAGAEFALYLSEAQLRQLYMASLVVLGGRSLLGAIGNVRRLSRGYFAKKPL